MDYQNLAKRQEGSFAGWPVQRKVESALWLQDCQCALVKSLFSCDLQISQSPSQEHPREPITLRGLQHFQVIPLVMLQQKVTGLYRPRRCGVFAMHGSGQAVPHTCRYH